MSGETAAKICNPVAPRSVCPIFPPFGSARYAVGVTGIRPTTAWVDPQALASNWAEACRLAGSATPIAVVKADAYGHGAIPTALTLRDAGCRDFAVATVAEGRELREGGLQEPILVLGGAHDAREAAAAAASELTLVLHRMDQLPDYREAARAAGHRMRIEVEIDTGMARMGLSPAAWAEDVRTLTSDPDLELEGVFTHLATADEKDLDLTRAQLERFATLLAQLRDVAPLPRRIHVANSAGLMAGAALAGAMPPEVNAVRPGLMLYGVYPAPHFESVARLAPVMTLTSEIVTLRELRPGEPVGYGATWHAEDTPTRIATIPVGYADGIPWALGNQGLAVVGGRAVPIAGRVSMDLITLALGPSSEGPIAIGDEVILFGASRGGPQPPRVEDVAQTAGTIPYELLVRVGSRVPRKVSPRTKLSPSAS